MSDVVVALRGGPTGQRQVVQSVVEELERLLEMARSGEIIAFTAAFSYYDNAGGFQTAGFVGGYSLLGALTKAKHDLLMAMDEL